MTDFDTETLAGVYQEVPRTVPSFFLDTFFPTSMVFEQEEIKFDMVDNASRRLAPFVAPMVQGRVMKERGSTMKSFKPAYIKPKHAIEPSRLIKRRPGEALGGTQSLASRRDAIVASILQDQKDLIHRRWEWMASQAVIYGSVTVTGDDYPTVVVDFQRRSGNTKTLSGGALWSAGTSTPIDDIESWGIELMQSAGYVVDAVIMGGQAYKAYRAHAQVKELLKTDVRSGSDRLALSALSAEVVQLVGTVGTSNTPIYVYNDFYHDDSGTATPFLDPRDVLVVSRSGVAGVRAFGAIMDKSANYQAVEVFTKSYLTEDPSAEWILSQSAPLMIPVRPNAVMRVRVLS